MGGKSKNNPDNRQAATKNFCTKCNQDKKVIKVAKASKQKICFECKCGRFDKMGNEF